MSRPAPRKRPVDVGTYVQDQKQAIVDYLGRTATFHRNGRASLTAPRHAPWSISKVTFTPKVTRIALVHNDGDSLVIEAELPPLPGTAGFSSFLEDVDLEIERAIAASAYPSPYEPPGVATPRRKPRGGPTRRAYVWTRLDSS